MSTAIVAASVTSPFDAIRHEDARGEYWLGRELGPVLGYDSWRRFSDALERAKVSCEVAGFLVSDHFAGAGKMVGVGSGARRKLADVQLSRYACYLVAMCGDVRKQPVAQAQSYFAMKTRQAELLAARDVSTHATLPPSPWGKRLLRSLADHRRELRAEHPDGWSVISAAVPEILGIEAALGEHGVRTGDGDLPDGSLGSHWSRYVSDHKLGEPLGRVPLLIPTREYVVPVRVYSNAIMGRFNRFLSDVYLPRCLPEYLARKPEFKPAGAVALASVADAACHALAGRPAELPGRMRTQLNAAGGFVRAGSPRALSAPKRKQLAAAKQGSLFEAFN